MATGEEIWHKDALFTAEIYDLISELEPKLSKYGFELEKCKTQSSQSKVFLKIKVRKIEKSK